MSRSESPIEEDFLSALIAVCPKVVLVPSTTTHFGLHRMAMDDEQLDYVFVVPQMRVGPYRADFVMAAYYTAMQPKMLCVECDGRDFHLASHEQIARDRTRDSFFEGTYFGVQRYSGSQIKRDPYACAREAVEIVTSGKIARGDEGWKSLGASLETTLIAANNYSFNVHKFDERQKARRVSSAKGSE